MLQAAPSDYEQLLSKYSTMLLRVAYSRAQNRADAEDIVSETWVRYFRSAPDFESEEHRKAWLLRVCVNCANTLLSSAWRKKSVQLEETLPGDDAVNTDAADIVNAVRSLPERYRTVIHLFYYEDLSVRQIAEIVGSRENAVKTQLFRARQMLKDKLGGEYGDL